MIVILLLGVRLRRFFVSYCCNVEYYGISDVDESCCNSWGIVVVVVSGGIVDDIVVVVWLVSVVGLVVIGVVVNGVNFVVIVVEFV